jgi:hypothetical protein
LHARSLVARDFTGDQIVDLALVSPTSNEVCLLSPASGDADGTMTRRLGLDATREPHAVAIAAGDFDADGRYDAVSGNTLTSANNLSVLSNCARDCGARSVPSRVAHLVPGQAALRGDANDDGRVSAADLVAVAAR